MFNRCYPTISAWINDILGTDIVLPIQSFGFFVALAFIAAALVVTSELKRKEKLGLVHKHVRRTTIGEPATATEIAINALIGFVIGFKLLAVFFSYSSCVADPQGFVFSLEGNFLGGVIGAIAAGYLKYRDKAKKRLDKPKTVEVDVHPHQMVGDMLIVAAVSGFIGAKVFNFLEAPGDFQAFLEDPAGNLFAGLTIYGGLIFGAIGVSWYARKHNINVIHIADAAAPSLLLGYGIGRIGCHVAGDGDWGIVNTLDKPGFLAWLPDGLWAYSYPHNIINEGVLIPGCTEMNCRMLVPAVFPTPIYETFMAVALFGVLWFLRKRISIPGMIVSLYLIFAGIERFLIEQIRVNTTYNIGTMEITQAEIISVVFILSGIGLGIFFYNRNKKRPTPEHL